MNQYNYHQRLHEIWSAACKKYENEQRGSETYFNADEQAFLDGIGMTAQELYDYVEDYVRGGDPDFVNMAQVTEIRRAYFLQEMQGQRTGKTVDPSTYPAKKDEVRGIPWLPRLIEKAKAKLRGELDLDTMYGCGGDRNFFRTYDITPAEFLLKVRDNMENDEAVIDWIASKERTEAAAG